MRAQVAKQRKDGDLQPIEGWDATKLPTYPPLLQVIKALGDIPDKDGVAEMGSDCNDDKADGLSIVWADYAYFTDGSGSLRDMHSWVCIDGDHYLGIDLDGREWKVPFTNPDAADTAACKLTTEPTW